MLDPKMEQALNGQINHELASAYRYLAMGAHLEHLNFTGMALWLLKQREEELVHAMRLVRYVLDRGGKIDLEAVEKPKSDFDSIRSVFQRALEMEQRNTLAINEIYGLAVDLKDYATQSNLQWFIDEQVEEEKLVAETLGLVEIAGEDKSALLVLNRQLGERQGDPKVE